MGKIKISWNIAFQKSVYLSWLKEDSIRYSDQFWKNSRVSLLATVSHHILHYLIDLSRIA